jgi:UrcA family protein
MKKLTALIALTVITGFLCADAEAGTVSDVPSEAVRYTDLNVANSRDVAALYWRIDAAAGKVCGQRLAPGSLVVSKTWQLCIRNALRHAVATVNASALTAYAAVQGAPLYDSRVARNR